MPQPQTPQLEYAPRRAAWHRRRRVRRACLWAALAALAVSGFWWVPPVRDHAEMLYRQHRCLTYAAPAEDVAYEGDPSAAAALLAGGRGYVGVTFPPFGVSAGLHPPCADVLGCASGDPIVPPAAVVFMHERRTPSGAPRLVVVGLDANPWATWGVRPVAVVYAPSWWRGPVRRVNSGGERLVGGMPLDLLGVRGSDLQLCAGQPDPADPTHFTIGYALSAERGTVDGWLRDDDRVDLQVRDGPALRPAAAPPAMIRVGHGNSGPAQANTPMDLPAGAAWPSGE